MGYSTDIAAAVWVGYDDALPLGWGEAGAVTALPAWMSFMKVANEGKPPTEFPKPSSIVTANVDPATGLLPYPGETDAIEEEFLDGTVPTGFAAGPMLARLPQLPQRVAPPARTLRHSAGRSNDHVRRRSRLKKTRRHSDSKCGELRSRETARPAWGLIL